MTQLKASPIKAISGLRWAWIVVFWSWSLGLQAQGWEISFGGNKEDFGQKVIQTIDEGYAILAVAESYSDDNDPDIYVIRTDVDGKLIWANVFDEGIRELGFDLLEMPDGDLVIVGYIEPDLFQPEHVYLLRIDKRGRKKWSRTYEAVTNERGIALTATSDGGFLIIGQTLNPLNGKDDILALKVDADGLEEWREIYGTTKEDKAVGVIPTPDGYIFAANVKGNEGPQNDIAIYKITKQGNLSWTKVYDSGVDEQATSVIATRDGNLVLAGYFDNFREGLVVKANMQGDTLWWRTFNPTPEDDYFEGILELENGNLVAVGLTLPTAGNVNILLVKLDSKGNPLWSRSLGANDKNDIGYDVAPTVDGGFVITGNNAKSDLLFITDITLLKVDGEGNYESNRISGKVYRSDDGCNPYNPETDKLLPRWVVKAQSADRTYYSVTNEAGEYDMTVDTGIYTVTLLKEINPNWDICNPIAITVDFNEFYDTTVYDFPVEAAYDCPLLNVKVSSSGLTYCNNATYSVNYCNDGPATAANSKVVLKLDQELTFLSASLPYEIEGDSIIVATGDIGSTDCGQFTFDVAVACDGIIEAQAAWVNATIYPNASCIPTDPNWDMSSIQVSGVCENDSLKFRIKNIGTNPTSQPLNYVVVEDVIVFKEGIIDTELQPQETIEVAAFEANEEGATYRLIAEQTPGHPGQSLPTVAVEGCPQAGLSSYTTGLVTQFPENDSDPYVAINVQEVKTQDDGATFMRGHPKGYNDRIIVPNTEIEYTIVFANTVENDTIDRVVIRDTLPLYLDPASVILGAASHPYDFEINRNGVLKITFDQIQLQAGGSAEEASSRGFVQFRISQKPNNPVGTVIENSAAVYFDYQAPVKTNTISHEVGCEDFFEGCILLVGIDGGPNIPQGVKIKVAPNPFFESATVEIEGIMLNEIDWLVYDSMGRLVRSERHKGNRFEFYRQNLPAGFYTFQAASNGQLVAAGKMIVR